MMPLPSGKRKRIGLTSDTVSKYWDIVGPDVPCIFFIFQLLSKCAATEAAAERLFSSEAVIHTDLRNQLAPGLTEALVKIRRNYPILGDQDARLRSLGADVFVEEFEELFFHDDEII